MYLIDERDRVIELKDVPQSSVGAPLPIVLSDEFTIVLAYIIQDLSPEWNETALCLVDTDRPGESLALVEFELYQSYMFGAPNDEAFSSHPLAARGLHPYAAFRIDDSSWVRQLERMNSVHPNHNPNKFQELKHFVFAFHDSTFECVAKGFRISEYEGTLEGLLPIMLGRLTLTYDV
jgi:hypothetical protein